MEAVSKTFTRGLTELEISVIKRMRQWGLPRDYILSFVNEPGRILTPACIGEIMCGDIGADIEPASEAIVRLFVNERLNAIRPIDHGRFDEPISPWRIQQALLWARTSQTSLFREEGYETEFKILFESSKEKIAKYMKTMCAFANNFGGYIFFGLEDGGRAVNFDNEKYQNFDWDAFDKLLEARFKPYITWRKAVVDIPQTPEFRFDAELIKREAKLRNVPPEYYQWILEPDPRNLRAQIGVIYTYKSDIPVMCTQTVAGALKSGAYYVRRMARNGHFEELALKANDISARAQTSDYRPARLAEFKGRVEALKTAPPQSDDDEPKLL